MILSQASSRTRGSQCSCENCDSVECFSLRHLKQPCSCELCINSQTCLYPQKLIISEPTQVTEADLPISASKTEAPVVIEPHLSKTTEAITNTAPCSVRAVGEVSKVVEKVISKSSNTAKSPKPSKIPISTDKISYKSNSITKAAKRIKKNLSNRTKTTKANDPNVVQELIKKEVVYVYDRNNNTQTTTTKESKISFRNFQANNCIDEDSMLNSVDAKYSDKDMEFARSTARLAAQIMNVPYTDLQSSLPESKSSVLQQVSKYPIDIFKRIKEAYKACSCKVCECIAGKTITADDICNCKPCDCNDCKHLTINFLDSKLFPVDDEGCPCIRCDRKDCKGIVKGNTAQPRICDCQMSERQTKFEKGCDCEPCQCIDCSLKTGRQKNIVVARVEQSYLNMCDCSPCECADCLRSSYGISNEHEATTHREMSTGVNRHPQCQCEACITEACIPDDNQLCWCVRHNKVMSKPFQRTTPDYDIRRAKLPFCFEPKDKNRNDTLAMYASINNTYPQKLLDYKQNCSCDPCECLVCNHTDNRECLNVLLKESVTNYGDNRAQEQLYSIEEKMGEHSIKINKENCGCDFCDCENCETKKTFKDIPKRQLTKKICSSDTCSCSPCGCLNAGNQIIEDEKPFYDCQQFLDDNVFCNQPVPQPYSTLRNENDPYFEIYRGFNYNDNESTKNSIMNHIPTKDREKLNVYENYPYNRNCYQKNTKPHQYVSSRADIVQLDTGICAFSNKEETDFKELRQSPSVNSSMSCLKDSGSLSPLSRNKKKSADSSCNSSGHDYPDYLIHFPKTTVQKCIDEVMSSNFMNTECIKINYMNKLPPMMSTSYKNTIKYKPIPNPPSLMQQNNETPKLKNDKCSLTTLNVGLKHTGSSSKSSLHRTSGVAIETTSKKAVSQNDGNRTGTSKLTKENNSPILEDVIKSVTEIEVPKIKIKKHVTVNPMYDDLDRVQNTLTDAREFSKQLVKLLEKYETANENFNISKTFEKTDCSTNSEVKLQTAKQHSRMDFKKDTDVGSTQFSESQKDIRLKKSTVNETSIKYIQNKDQSKSSSSKLLLENYQSKSSNSVRKVEDDKTKKAELSIENMLPEKTNKNKVCLIHLNKNDVSIITEPAYIFKTGTDNNNLLKATKSCNVKDFLNTIAEEKVSDILSDVYKANSEKKDKEMRKKRNFNYMYKRTMTMSKKMNIMPRHENFKLKGSVVTEESKTTPEGIEIKRNGVHSSKNEFTKNVAKDNLTPTAVNKNRLNKTNLQSKTDKNQDFVVIKSFENAFDLEDPVTNPPLVASQLETESNDDLEHVDPTLSNLDLKKVFQSIPLKPEVMASDVETVFLQENKAPINIQSEVNKLLDMPLLQPYMDKINDICNSKKKSASKCTNCSETYIAEKEEVRKRSFSFNNKPENAASKFTNCSKTNIAEKTEVRERSFSFYNKPFLNNKYNSLKVNYVNVRQVSDDLVLVRWDAPQNLNYVEGYEVLIDGKAVLKIRNPNKCNAVITGLLTSDEDKILLSIRTLTNLPNIERMPATSIIYRPQLAVY